MSTRLVWIMKGDLVKKTHKTKQFPLEKIQYIEKSYFFFFNRRKLGSEYGAFPHYICVFIFWKYMKYLFFIGVFYVFIHVHGIWCGRVSMCTCGVQRMASCRYLCPTGGSLGSS